MTRRSSALAFSLALCVAGCATSPAPDPYVAAAPPPAPEVEALTDGNGMTLYVFDRDVAASGKSACNGPCAANWPPLPAGEGSTPFGQYTIIVRDDGAKQWAYKGRPLYRWGKDQKRGDRTGDNFMNAWHVATP